MKRINVDLAELQAFACLAELRSFRAAADELGLTGSAVSRAIARIEDRLGTRLFDRDTRNVALTPQGAALQQLTQRILSEAESALTEFEAYLSARRGRVTLAGLPSITASLLPGLIVRFLASHPEVEISIVDALSDGVADAVLEGRADFGFTAGAVGGSGRLSFRPLVEDEFVAVGYPGGPLDDVQDYRWQEFDGRPFVAMIPGTSVRALTDAACRAGRPVDPATIRGDAPGDRRRPGRGRAGRDRAARAHAAGPRPRSLRHAPAPGAAHDPQDRHRPGDRADPVAGGARVLPGPGLASTSRPWRRREA